jgi:hypothetical protein
MSKMTSEAKLELLKKALNGIDTKGVAMDTQEAGA